MINNNDDDLLPPLEAAAEVKESVHTLAGKRSRGGGPTFVKKGGRIFYIRRDLKEYILNNRFDSTAQARAAKHQREAARC